MTIERAYDFDVENDGDAVCRDGLEDQLLGAVVVKERPDLEKLKSEMDGNKFRNKNILWSLFERITSLGKALTLYLREFSNSPLKPLGILSSFCCCANH